MRPLALAAVQAGLIDADIVAQFKRWGMLPRSLDASVVEDPTLAIERIQFALEAEEQVRLQSTDLDILKYYLDKENQRKGQLVIVDNEFGTKATKTITYALRTILSSNQYIIPWISDSIIDTITNGSTYLRCLPSKSCVYFDSVDELYFGDVKAFMVCTSGGSDVPA